MMAQSRGNVNLISIVRFLDGVVISSIIPAPHRSAG